MVISKIHFYPFVAMDVGARLRKEFADCQKDADTTGIKVVIVGDDARCDKQAHLIFIC